MFGRILNTSLPIVIITFDIRTFYTTSLQNTLVGVHLVFGTISIFFSIHFMLIQVNLPKKKYPKY